MCVGFGFDELTNDYKVIRIVYPETEYYHDFYYTVVEVYTPKTKSWRRIAAPDGMYCIRGDCYGGFQDPYSQCFLNGVVHWPGFKQKSSVWSIIVTFNVHEEFFGEVKLPACLEGISTRSYDLKVTVCKNMLTLILSQSWNSSIWVMKEYGNVDSWTQLFKFNNLVEISMPKALYVRFNMDVLILGKLWPPWMNRLIVLFSFVNAKAKVEVVGTLDESLEGLYLGLYEEGLGLFNELKANRNCEVEDDEAEDSEVEDEEVEDSAEVTLKGSV